MLLGQLRADALRRVRQVGRPDRFVRFLGTLARGKAIRCRRQVGSAVLLADQVAARIQGIFRDARAVGTHVGNEGHRAFAAEVHALVQFLGNRHGSPGRVAEADVGLLLERAGGERRRRLLGAVLLLDLGDAVGGGQQRVGDLHRFLLGLGRELFAVPFGQLGQEGLAGPRFRQAGRFFFLLLGLGVRRFLDDPKRRRGPFRGPLRPQVGGDLPVFFLLELLDLPLALDNQAHGHRLHPAGAEAPGDFLAQQRTELVADRTIEEAARLLGADPVHVDGAGVRESVLDRFLGDFVEGDPANALVGQLQGFLQVPGDRLALAVGVGRQVDQGGGGGAFLQVGEDLLMALVGQIDIGRHPAGFDVDADVLAARFGRQIADVAVAGPDLEAGAQVFLDRLRLGRRLDDHQASCPSRGRWARRSRAF